MCPPEDHDAASLQQRRGAGTRVSPRFSSPPSASCDPALVSDFSPMGTRVGVPPRFLEFRGRRPLVPVWPAANFCLTGCRWGRHTISASFTRNAGPMTRELRTSIAPGGLSIDWRGWTRRMCARSGEKPSRPGTDRLLRRSLRSRERREKGDFAICLCPAAARSFASTSCISDKPQAGTVALATEQYPLVGCNS
ncbi:hypothetical protein K466DRAFT_223977 [Polyporus arcularius HHB13444]|uniref:Uncharacterized protein n=1 Tax=Polyporus arcularius HHB13444 TaxID=1314778 RepID=A0A5C3PXB3_9APHY|nr:hypothetical protein K466DRAFT_223977 [Polyporus arcularius HHB13444]